MRPRAIGRAGLAAEPGARRRQSDLVWELENCRGERCLLLSEHQARVDSGMSVRMMEYLTAALSTP